MNNRLKNIVSGKSSVLHIQLVRYLIAGTIAFAADFILLKILTENLHFYYLSSAVIGYCAGLLASYLLSVLWVFDKRRLKNHLAELASFAVIGLAGLGLTYLLMWLFTEKAGVYYLLSKVLTTVIVFVWNFTAKKIILFSK